MDLILESHSLISPHFPSFHSSEIHTEVLLWTALSEVRFCWESWTTCFRSWPSKIQSPKCPDIDYQGIEGTAAKVSEWRMTQLKPILVRLHMPVLSGDGKLFQDLRPKMIMHMLHEANIPPWHEHTDLLLSGLYVCRWRAKLTGFMQSTYLEDNTFYKLGSECDNPDQRMVQDAARLCSGLGNLAYKLAAAPFKVIYYSIWVWSFASWIPLLVALAFFIIGAIAERSFSDFSPQPLLLLCLLLVPLLSLQLVLSPLWVLAWQARTSQNLTAPGTKYINRAERCGDKNSGQVRMEFLYKVEISVLTPDLWYNWFCGRDSEVSCYKSTSFKRCLQYG